MKYSSPAPGGLVPWQPSTWPKAPATWDPDFVPVLRGIFGTTILDEIRNVIEDAQARKGSLVLRGHVVALAILCAIDTVSSYAYRMAVIGRCPTCGRPDGVRARY